MDTILYVDDEQINLDLFRKLYKGRFEVLAAVNGAEGLEILKGHPEVEAVISDMRMPGMSGIEFICKVHEFHPELPCMILSGYSMGAEITDAMKRGVILSFMNKPFQKEALEKVVSRMIVSKK